ncbi:hypothetical protein MP228_012047 [Amoeboaphelidium protococcarum]|nr:hypothetical protein MP228_012047 [Amoeboaphelidium protococcarum]
MDDSENWDSDFGGNDVAPQIVKADTEASTALVGLHAGNFQVEDWDDEFQDDIEVVTPSTKQVNLTKNSQRPSIEKSAAVSVPNGATNAKSHQPDAKSPVQSQKQQSKEPDEAEDDWDSEFLGEQIDRTKLTKNLHTELFATPTSASSTSSQQGVGQELSVQNFRFEDKFALNAIKTVKYPKSTMLFSLTINQSKFIPESHMENFIVGLLDNVNDDSRANTADITNSGDSLIQKLFDQFMTDYRLNNFAQCEDTIQKYFDCLEQQKIQQTAAIEEQALRLVSYNAKWKVFSQLQILSNNGFKSMINGSAAFDIQMRLLKIESSVHHMKNVLPCEHELCQLYELLLREQSNNIDGTALISLKLAVLSDVQCLNFGIDPLSTEALKLEDLEDDQSDAFSMIHDQMRIAVDSEYRFKEIQALYSKSSLSYVKAKAAYVCALYEMHENNSLAVAESLAFECICLLHQLKTRHSNPILSTLGYNALRLYGELLLLNKKALFAIYAFDAALENLRLRKRPVTFIQLSNLASICLDNCQIEKAIKFYYAAIDLCALEEKHNEYFHLVQTLANVYIESGFAYQAIRLLKACFNKYINLGNLQNHWIDQLRKITIMIADVCLQVGDFAEASAYLSTFIAEHSTSVDCFDLTLKLAKVYRKCGWTFDAIDLLCNEKQIREDAILNGLLFQADFVPSEAGKAVGRYLFNYQTSNTQSHLVCVQIIKCLIDLHRYSEAAALYDRYMEDSDLVLKARLISKVSILSDREDLNQAFARDNVRSSMSIGNMPMFSSARKSSFMTRRSPSEISPDGSAKAFTVVRNAFDILVRESSVSNTLMARRWFVSLFLDHTYAAVAIDGQKLQDVLKSIQFDFPLEKLLDYAQKCLANSLQLRNLKHCLIDYVNVVELLLVMGKSELCLEFYKEAVRFVDFFYCVSNYTGRVPQSVLTCYMKLSRYLFAVQDSKLRADYEYVACAYLQLEQQFLAHQYHHSVVSRSGSLNQSLSSSSTSKDHSSKLIRGGAQMKHVKSGLASESLKQNHSHSTSKTTSIGKNDSFLTKDSDSDYNVESESLSLEATVGAVSKQMSDKDELALDFAAVTMKDGEMKTPLCWLLAYELGLRSVSQSFMKNKKSWKEYVDHVQQSVLQKWKKLAVDQSSNSKPNAERYFYILDLESHIAFMSPQIGLYKAFSVKIIASDNADVSSSSPPGNELADKSNLVDRAKNGLIQFKLCASKAADIACTVECPVTATLNDVLLKLFSPTQDQQKVSDKSKFSTTSSKSSAISTATQSSLASQVSTIQSIAGLQHADSAELSKIRVVDKNSKFTSFQDQVRDGIVDISQYSLSHRTEKSGKPLFMKLNGHNSCAVSEIQLLMKTDAKNQKTLPSLFLLPIQDVIIPAKEFHAQKKRDVFEILTFLMSTYDSGDNQASLKTLKLLHNLRTTWFPRIICALQQFLPQRTNQFTVDVNHPVTLVCAQSCAAFPWESYFDAPSLVRQRQSYQKKNLISYDQGARGEQVVQSNAQMYCFLDGDFSDAANAYVAKRVSSEVGAVVGELTGVDDSKLQLISGHLALNSVHRSSFVKAAKKIPYYQQKYPQIKFVSSNLNRVSFALNQQVQYHVLVVMYSDLIGFSSLLSEIMSLNIYSTVVFVPPQTCKKLIQKLHDIVDSVNTPAEVHSKDNSSTLFKKLNSSSKKADTSKKMMLARNAAQDIEHTILDTLQQFQFDPLQFQIQIRKICKEMETQTELPVVVYESKCSRHPFEVNAQV